MTENIYKYNRDREEEMKRRKERWFIYFIVMFCFMIFSFLMLGKSVAALVPHIVSLHPGFDPSGTLGINISGSSYNLSASILKAGNPGESISMVSFWWISNADGIMKANVSVLNTTTNQVEFSTSFDTKSIPDGQYNLTLGMYNLSTESMVQDQIVNSTLANNIIIDNTPPVVGSVIMNVPMSTIIGPSGKILFNITANDSITSVQKVTIEFVGTNSNVNQTALKDGSVWTVELSPTVLQDGSYTVRAYATDTLGNVNMNEAGLSFRVDKTPPRVTELVFHNFTNKINLSAGLSQNMVTVNATVTDSASLLSSVLIGVSSTNGSEFFISTSSLSNLWGGILNLSLLTEGAHTIRFYANDTVSNLNNTEILPLVIDRTKPSVSVSCTPATVTTSAVVNCSCTASDSLTGIQTKGFSTGASIESITTSGSGTFNSSVCTAVDNAGNLMTATGSWMVTAASSSESASSSASGGSGSSSSSSSGSNKTVVASSSEQDSGTISTVSTPSETKEDQTNDSELQADGTLRKTATTKTSPSLFQLVKDFVVKNLFGGSPLTASAVKKTNSDATAGSMWTILIIMGILVALGLYVYLGKNSGKK